MSVLREAFPLLFTSFVNKCGAIGLNLLPMLLVERHIGTGDSSFVMTLVKIAYVFGTFFGGWICDRVSLKSSVILSFTLAAIGLGFIPVTKSLTVLAICAVIGQIGQAMFQSPARLLILGMVHPDKHQESIGWLRTANNLGLIISYGLGAVFSQFGILALMLFDSVTSLLAAILGWKTVPRTGKFDVTPKKIPEDHKENSPQGPIYWNLLALCALTIGGYSFLYDIFMVSSAAKFKILFGDKGLSVFSTMMVVNTTLCALFAVWASKIFKNPAVVFPAGLAMTAAGAALVVGTDGSYVMIFLGVALFTFGEIVFASLASFTLIKIMPNVKDRGSIYGLALVIQALGRIAGGGLAFPMVVHGNHPVAFVLISGSIFIGMSFFMRPGLSRHLHMDLGR